MLLVCGVGGDITFESYQLCIDQRTAKLRCSIDGGKFIQWLHEGEIIGVLFAFQPFLTYSRTEESGAFFTTKLISSWPRLEAELRFGLHIDSYIPVQNTTVECRGFDRRRDYKSKLFIQILTGGGK